MEKKRGGVNDDRFAGSKASLPLSTVLSLIGDVDYMEEGHTTDMFKDHRVYIDNYSSNRVVAVNKENESFEFPMYRLLVANTITQQNTRLSCRFTSLLPDISNL
jgi:hypothetical protein